MIKSFNLRKELNKLLIQISNNLKNESKIMLIQNINFINQNTTFW